MSIVPTTDSPTVPRQWDGVVIGAGVAGAGLARAMAEQGQRVLLLDADDHPAAGASGLPVGLVCAHVSGDDNALSQLTRAGVSTTFAAARRYLVQGQDWAPTGLLERRLSGKARRGRWPQAWRVNPELANSPLNAQALAWCAAASPEQMQRARLPALTLDRTDPNPPPQAIWHRQAGWLQPQTLIRALLHHPLITWCGNSTVQGLRRGDAQLHWSVQVAGGATHSAAHVLVATGPGSAELLQTALPQLRLPTEALRGQLTGGCLHSDMLDNAPAHPVNGLGSFVPHVPQAGQLRWWAGATYDHSRNQPCVLAQDQSSNLAQLALLLPALAPALAASDPGALLNWSGVRCTTSDRLPVAGPVHPAEAPGLHVVTALGSRGLTLGLLCANITVARLLGQPLPVNAALADALLPARFAGRR